MPAILRRFAILFLLLGSVYSWSQPFVAKPLNDLGTGRYKGFEGGLYENGSNVVPSEHNIDGLALLDQIKPVRGKFVFLGIGMSNAMIEFETFKDLAAASGRVNHDSMVVVNGALGNMTACAWAPATHTPRQHNCRMPGFVPNQYDRVRDEILKPLGLSEDQVEVIWMLNADPRPDTSLPASDADAYEYERYLADTVRATRKRYPNLKMLFISSRAYAGYATTPLNPEPYAYEYGFSVKWAIQAQIDQLRGGKVDSRAGDLDYKKGVAPWIAWGPYLWADGTTPRSDGLTWDRSEFGDDGTHPNFRGRQKIARLLMDFFLNSPYTIWFKK